MSGLLSDRYLGLGCASDREENQIIRIRQKMGTRQPADIFLISTRNWGISVTVQSVRTQWTIISQQTGSRPDGTPRAREFLCRACRQ